MLPFCKRPVLIHIFGPSLVLNYCTGGNDVLGIILKKLDLHLQWLKLVEIVNYDIMYIFIVT